MDTKKILSICIPTYNRATELEQTLKSICKSENMHISDIEICISDNASTDNTPALIEKYKANGLDIKYYRSSKNMGADRNFIKAVELASSAYCWLLGSDDLVKKDSIKEIIGIINSKIPPQIILFNRDEFKENSEDENKKSSWFLYEKTYNTGIISERIEYLKSSLALGSIFSYISSIVFDRNQWALSKSYDMFIGTNYIHVAKLFDIVNSGVQLTTSKRAIVNCRISASENTFHGSLGEYKRLYIDFYYLMMASYIFGMDSFEYKLVQKILKKERSIRQLLSIKHKLNTEDREKLYRLLKNNGFIKEYTIVKSLPLPIISCLIYIKRLLHK